MLLKGALLAMSKIGIPELVFFISETLVVFCNGITQVHKFQRPVSWYNSLLWQKKTFSCGVQEKGECNKGCSGIQVFAHAKAQRYSWQGNEKSSSL